MTKQNEDKMLNFFVKTFDEVLVPVLEDQNKRIDTLDQKVTGLDEGMKGLDKKVIGLNQKVTGLDQKVTGLDKKVTEMSETLDSHTASLMKLEKMPKLLTDIYNEVKGMRSKVKDHKQRISRLEDKILYS